MAERGRGSSGITDQSIVEDQAALLRQVTAIITRLGQGALVENYVRGREVTVGIIGRPRALGARDFGRVDMLVDESGRLPGHGARARRVTGDHR